jgi:capsular exopolysaccharide synthesis family protein
VIYLLEMLRLARSEENHMEIKQLLSLLRRWAWLLIFGLVLGMGAGFIFILDNPPAYQAETRVLVVRGSSDKTNIAIYGSDSQLTETYVELFTSKPILSAAAEELGYKVNIKKITVAQVNGTQVVKVTVENNNPERAAAIANTLVKVLIAQSDSLQSARFSDVEDSLKLQIDQVQKQMTTLQTELTQVSDEDIQKQLKEVDTQIADLQAEITTLSGEIAVLQNAARPLAPLKPEQSTQLAEKQARLAQLQPLLTWYQEIHSNLVFIGRPVQSGNVRDNPRQTQIQSTLSKYQELYLNLLDNLETVRLTRLQNTPSVIQIDAAAVPVDPVRPPWLYVLMVGVVGLALGLMGGVLYDHLDDTLKTSADVETILGLPVIGLINATSSSNEHEIYIVKEPSSPTSEAFRSLRINLELMGKEKPLQVLLVADVDKSDKKTMAAVNLAAAFARSGKQVALLDADLHQPHLHSFLGLEHQPGLSDILKDNLELQFASVTREDIPSVTFIPAGSPTVAPLELLESDKMSHLLVDLQKKAQVLIIISPPMFVADLLVLASKADGVLLVLRPGRAYADSARAAMEQLARANARVLGVVFIRGRGK